MSQQKVVKIVRILAVMQWASFSFSQAASYRYENFPAVDVLDSPEIGGERDYSDWTTGSWDPSSRVSDQGSIARRKRSIISLIMGPTYGHKVSQHKTEAQLLHPPPPADGFVSVRGKKQSPTLIVPMEMRQKKYKGRSPSSPASSSSYITSSSQDLPPSVVTYLSRRDQSRYPMSIY